MVTQRKNIQKAWLLGLLIICVLMVYPLTANAASQKIRNGAFYLGPEEEVLLGFSVHTPGYVVLDMNVSLRYWGYSKNEKLQVVLTEYEGDNPIENDTFDYFEDGINGDLGRYFDYTAKQLPAGNYKYTICNHGKHSLKIQYTITEYSSYSTSLLFSQDAVSIETGGWTKIKCQSGPTGTRLIVRDIWSSNDEVAEAYIDYEKNEIEIYAGNRTGNVYITFCLLNGQTYRIKVSVYKPKNPVLLYTSYQLYTGEKFTNVAYYASGNVKWSSSNKKIATVSSKGVVTAKKVGTCYIKAKIGKKTLKCKVKVVRQNPNFYAQLTDYYTRDNYFVIRMKNVSNKTLTITSGIKVEQDHYKSFDRSIKLKKKVTLKPNQSANVRFYVKGRTTWYRYSDFTLRYKFSFDGKTYEASVWDSNSNYKNGKTWYHTFWDDEWYEDWWVA